MRFGFYCNDEKALQSVSPITNEYPSVTSPEKLYEALSMVWCAETCAPRMREQWTAENMTLGQCSVTAFLAQDIFGGRVYGILTENGNIHCFNLVGKCVFDLTSEQFGEKAGELDYGSGAEQSRDVHFSKEEKRLRYELLKERLRHYTRS